MLPKKQRLSPQGFVGRRPEQAFSTTAFLVKAYTSGLEENRFAAIVGQAAERSAVRRHALRRQILECLGRWPKLGRDFLVIALPTIRDFGKGEVAAALEEAERRIKRRTHNQKP